VSPQALEQLLRDLPRIGTLVKDRGYRQVWRFEVEGSGYYLKFYPRRGWQLKRLVRGNPAMREFSRLQALQKADVPAPRAVAHLIGFRLNSQIGDAVILQAIEPSVTLDQYVNDLLLDGEPIPDHHGLAQRIVQLLGRLGQAGLGHNDLHLGNLLLRGNDVLLLDGYAVHRGGLTLNNVMRLAHSVRNVATRADLQRGWEELGPGGMPPRSNPTSVRQWRKLMERTRGENEYFGKLRLGAWRGFFFKRYKYPRRWAPASTLTIQAEDWERAWPLLWDQMNSDQLTPLKRGASGDVWSGEVVLGGRPIAIVVKRPYRRYWYRYLNEIGRGSRAWRAWRKAWMLVFRDLPTAWPLLVLQKRALGYITDAVIVLEHVPGPSLAHADLDVVPPLWRDLLFRRTGAVLRKIDELGLSHFDAKSTNWIVRDDPKLGPGPILVDVDGIRFRRWQALGIRRLLRSMLEHPQYSPADSLSLCQGYAPFSPMRVGKSGGGEISV
jgi:tRNA A-37 threonylcarbamoyl transferase component Bud32